MGVSLRLTREELRKIARIEPGGAVVLGDKICCDGFSRKELRVVTHYHWDHVLGLKQSLTFPSLVVASEVTVEVLRLNGYYSPLLTPLRYAEEVKFPDGSRLALYPSDHVPGASQVSYVDEAGVKVVYTGDIGPSPPVLRADVLVIEATYGNPSFKCFSHEEAFSAILDIIEFYKSKCPVYIFAFRGKAEVLASKLLKSVDIPVLASESIYRRAKVFERCGLDFKGLIPARSKDCLLYTSPSPRDLSTSRMPSSA